MSKTFPFWLLLCAACVVSRPSERPALPQDPAELLARADAYFDSRDYENAEHLYELAAVAASTQGRKGLYVEAASQVAQTNALMGNLDAARQWLESASREAVPKEAQSWVRWLIARGAVEKEGGLEERALATFAEAHAFARKTHQPVRAVQAAHWAGVVAQGEAAIEWARRAIEDAGAADQPGLLSALWQQLAWKLEERGLHEEAWTAFRRARELVDPSDDHAVLVADWSLAHGLRLAGHPDQARALLELVSRSAEEAYRENRLPNDAEWIGHAQSELAELDLLAGDRDAAIKRLEYARRRFLEAGARRLAPQLLSQNAARLEELRRSPRSQG